MDLNLKGRSAIVCASSNGLGKACAIALAQEGVAVTINGRNADTLQLAAQEIADLTGRSPQTVCADAGTAAGRAALVAACPEPDILINNNGGPAPSNAGIWEHDEWLAAIEANMLSAILLIQTVIPGMRARRFGRVINIVSAMVKAPHAAMGLSAAARLGLVGFSKGLATNVASDNVTLNNLLPERIDTGRLAFMTAQLAKNKGISLDQARSEMMRPIPARRFGQPGEVSAACAFLCSTQASYITGQSLQIDGGAYAGIF